jgi:hypothetical protein
MQEARQKDLEQAFGVFQACFAIFLCPDQGFKHHKQHWAAMLFGPKALA